MGYTVYGICGLVDKRGMACLNRIRVIDRQVEYDTVFVHQFEHISCDYIFFVVALVLGPGQAVYQYVDVSYKMFYVPEFYFAQ